MAEPPISFYAWPWDLYDEGPEAAAEVLCRCGANTVHLAVAYHLATYLLPRNPRRSLYWGDAGAAYFTPHSDLYVPGPAPLPADLVHEDPGALERTVRALHVAGLKVRAWIVYGYNHALARVDPTLAKVDALGNGYLSQLCVGNRRVRAYALGLTRDVARNLDVDGLMGESLCFMGWHYGQLNAKTAVTPSPRAEFLLGLCFCADCCAAARQAGIDTDALRGQVSAWLREHLNGLPDDSQGDLAASDEWRRTAFDGQLQAFLRCRSRLASSLIDQTIAAAREELGDGTIVEWVGFGGIDGQDQSSLDRLVDERRVGVSTGTGVDELRVRFDRARQGLRQGARVVAAFYPGVLGSEKGFHETLKTARQAGAEGYRLYNYGLFSRRQLGWLEGADWSVMSNAQVDV